MIATVFLCKSGNVRYYPVLGALNVVQQAKKWLKKDRWDKTEMPKLLESL